MTEPTRDALHAETLAELAIEEANARRVAALTTNDDVDWTRIAERYAYAAECVREVPALREKVEALDGLRRSVTHYRGKWQDVLNERAALRAEHTAYKLSLLDALGPGVPEDEGRSIPDAIRALKAEVERLRADADRWRWIRQFCAVGETEDGEVGLWCDNGTPEPGPLALFLLGDDDPDDSQREGPPTQTVEELVDAARAYAAATREGTDA